jgi:diguanylate cyclase (GGDEF)-like protein
MPESIAPVRRAPLNSLPAKIIFFVFAATLLTAVAVSGVSIDASHRFLRGRLEAHFLSQLHGIAAHFDVRLDVTRRELVASLDAPALAAALVAVEDGDARARDALARRLEEAAARLPLVAGLALFDAGGADLASTGMTVTLPPEVRAEVASADGSEQVWWTAQQRPYLRLTLEAPRGARALALLDLARAAESLSGELASEGAALFLLGPGGERAPRVSPEDALERWRPPPELLGLAAGSGIVQYRAPDGSNVVGTAVSIGAPGVWLLLEESFSRAFEPVLAVVSRIFFVDVAIVLLFTVFAYRITASIVRPIEALSDGARQISQGKLDVEIPDSSPHDELGLLTRTFNDMVRKLRKNQHEIAAAYQTLKRQNEELSQANEILEQLSITDGLTKLHNHRFFQDYLTREIKRVTRANEPLAMLLVDLDDFKQLNDRLGHAAGDELLSGVARCMNEAVRDSDLLARYGGEEFVVLAGNTDLEGAVNLAEKLRTAVAETSFIVDDTMRPVRVTVSIGVAAFSGDRKAFFRDADRALYRAKAEGKNCVVADEESSV